MTIYQRYYKHKDIFRVDTEDYPGHHKIRVVAMRSRTHRLHIGFRGLGGGASEEIGPSEPWRGLTR